MTAIAIASQVFRSCSELPETAHQVDDAAIAKALWADATNVRS